MGLSAFNAARARARAEAEALAKASVINPKPVETAPVADNSSTGDAVEAVEKPKKTDAEKLKKGKK